MISKPYSNDDLRRWDIDHPRCNTCRYWQSYGIYGMCGINTAILAHNIEVLKSNNVHIYVMGDDRGGITLETQTGKDRYCANHSDFYTSPRQCDVSYEPGKYSEFRKI